MLHIIICSLGVDVSHLDDTNKRIYRCYTEESSLVYNKNVNTITVFLVRDESSLCIIPSQITAQLILSKLPNALQLKIDDFDVDNTS